METSRLEGQRSALPYPPCTPTCPVTPWLADADAVALALASAEAA